MMARAKCLARIDFKRRCAFRHLVAMDRRVNKEAALMDRLKTGLAQRHPVLVAQLRDNRFMTGSAGNKVDRRRDCVGRRFVLKIDVEPPFIGSCRVDLAGHQDRYWLHEREGGDILLQYVRLGMGAGEGKLPAIGQSWPR